MKKLLLLSLLLVDAGAFAADSKPLVLITVELPHAVLLPGVPFDATVKYTNLSDRRVAAGVTARVTITQQGGHPVTMERSAQILGVDFPSVDGNFELEPHGVGTGVMPWDQNWFHDDAAFTMPGRYDIELDVIGNAATVDEGVVCACLLHATPVRLMRITPAGEDAEVWARLQKSGRGQWPSHGFGSPADRDKMAAEIVRQHRDSAYYPYALVLGDDGAGKTPLSVAEDAVRRFQRSPAYPHLLIFTGLAAVHAAYAARNRGAFDEAMQDLQLFRFYNDEALRTGSDAVRVHARGNAGTADFLRSEFEKARPRQ